MALTEVLWAAAADTESPQVRAKEEAEQEGMVQGAVDAQEATQMALGG